MDLFPSLANCVPALDHGKSTITLTISDTDKDMDRHAER